MKIILTQDIKSLGKKGDVKEVAEGYARNFLFPKKMAMIATQFAIKNAQLAKEKEKMNDQEKVAKLKELAGSIQGKMIVVKSKQKDGKLFGSVSTKDIAKELARENIQVEEKDINLPEPIKKIGRYDIKIRLAEQVETTISLEVSGEK